MSADVPFTKQVECLIADKAAPPSVLVVDDDANDTMLISNALSSESCSVFVAHNVESAVDLLKRNEKTPFDIIFLDMKLPSASGVDILRLAHQLMPSTPCVIITGYPSGDFMVEATKLGYVELAIKPLLRETIVRIFRTHKIQTKK